MPCRNDSTNRTTANNGGYQSSDVKLFQAAPGGATGNSKSTTDSRFRRRFRIFFKFSAFIFSHLGLGFLVLAYTILGAFLFKHFEERSVGERNARIAEIRNTTVNRLWTETYKLNVLYKENWTAMAVKEIEHFQRSLMAAFKEDGYWPLLAEEQQDHHQKIGTLSNTRWSFIDSWMYSISIITTIGYANRPLTAEGKMTTMLYALFGIPIMLLFLSTIGSLLGRGLKFLYSFCCSCSTVSGAGGAAHDTAAFINLQSGSHDDHLHHLGHHHPHQDSYHQVHHIAMNSIVVGGDRSMCGVPGLIDQKSNIVSNNISNKTNNYQHAAGLYGAGCLCDLDETTGKPPDHSLCSPSKLFTADQCHHCIEHQFVDDDPQTIVTDGENVPFYFCFLLITLYIIGGSFMFHVWDGLPLLDGAYFCFVTLSTIGFGDILPEKTLSSSSSSMVSAAESKKRIIIIVIYILGGMTLVAMSFNIIYEQLAFKFKKIGYRIRLQHESTGQNGSRTSGHNHHHYHHHHHHQQQQQQTADTDFGASLMHHHHGHQPKLLSSSMNKFPSNEDIDV